MPSSRAPAAAAPPAKRRRRAANNAKPDRKPAPAAPDPDDDCAPAWERARQFGAAPTPGRRVSLPVISSTGAVQRAGAPPRPPRVSALKQKNPERRHSLSALTAPAAPQAAPPAAAPRVRSKLESFQTRLDALDAAKRRVASLSSAVLADPHANLPKLAELHALAARPSAGRPAALAILSQARVLADLAPGYRIRPVSEKEAEVKVSKDVARLRTFESALLAAHTRFVRFCVATARRSARGRPAGGPAANSAAAAAASATRAAAAQALCLLLQALPHFNLADAIAPAVCAVAADRDQALRAAARDALTAVLTDAPRASGPALQTCVLIARELANAAERTARSVPDEAVAPLTAIPFHRFTLLPQSKKAKNEPKGGKRFNRNRRRRREMEKAGKEEVNEKEAERLAAEKELDRDLREAEAGQNPSEMYAARKSLLDSVCRAYFNIIKSASADAEAARVRRKQLQEQTGRNDQAERTRRPPPALATSLTGLLRVAAYVPPGVLDATLAALTPLLEGTRLPTSTRLRSLAAAYAILSANARAASSDAASFTADCHSLDSALYACLQGLFPTPAPIHVDESLTWEAVEAVLAATAFRSLPAVRAAAFGRRLAITAANAPGHASSIALLRAAALVMPPRLVSCLFMQRGDTDAKGRNSTGSGALQPVAPGDADGIQRCDLDSDDADASGADRSAAWELAALQTHFHPAVREAAADCASGLCGEHVPGGRRNIVLYAKGFSGVQGGLNPAPADRPVGRAGKRKRQPSEMEGLYDCDDEDDGCRYFSEVFVESGER